MFPDVKTAVSLGFCSIVFMGALTGAARVGQRPWAPTAAIVLVVAIAAGICALPGSVHGRSTVIAHGLVSKSALRALSSLRLSDGDGDGYTAQSLGGADCDDAEAEQAPAGRRCRRRWHRRNCTGADAYPAWVAERLRPFPPRPAVSAATFLIVSIDSLRADHIGAWEYARPTPALDRFAATATRFSWAFTSSPRTLPAIASLLTGRHPSSLVWDGRGKLLMEESDASGLAEILSGTGYDTAAITCCD